MNLFYASTKSVVGNGQKKAIWDARWLNGSKPKAIKPLIYVVSNRKKWSINKVLNNEDFVAMIKIACNF
jgi:hypothetical protein